jgi:Regulatory P domain of the subtilisin-like proprotein convertases and other proteases
MAMEEPLRLLRTLSVFLLSPSKLGEAPTLDMSTIHGSNFCRPELTWRDIQHLCVETAGMINPDDDWEEISNGKKYSYKYGFGVLNAERYIKAAKTWPLVKPQTWFGTPSVQLGNGTLDINGTYSGGIPIVPGGVTSSIHVSRQMLEESNFEALEHINVKVWVNHTRRGDVEIELVSPNGIKSVLARKRISDSDDTGYPGWRFMSVKHW